MLSLGVNNFMSFSFSDYIAEIDADVAAVLSKAKEPKTPAAIDRHHPVRVFESELKAALCAPLGKDLANAVSLEMPAEGIKADYVIPAFHAAKIARQAPPLAAKTIADALRSAANPMIREVSACGGYVNIIVDEQNLYNAALRYISECAAQYGRSADNAGKLVLLDFSSPNIAKPLGIGHLRSTIIGHALANIYEWAGYSVVRDNHLGDWGTQFGELLYAYRTWGDETVILKDPIRELKNLYVRFHNEAKTNPAIEAEARQIFGELEAGNADLLELWKKFRDLSISGFENTYKRIGVNFDLYIGESFFAGQSDAVIADCLKNDLCHKVDDTEALAVDHIKGLPSFLLRKQDGSGLYITRDLAAMKYRVETFNPAVILYVVGSEQSLNFRQLFALAKEIGYLPETVRAEHVAFGMVLSGNKKMSTRAGTVVELEEVLEKAVAKAGEVLKAGKRDQNHADMQEVAETIGIGAVLYHDLRQLRTTNISFDWDRIVSLESGSSAYLQYTYVRIMSILAKAGGQNKLEAPAKYRFTSEKEFSLIKKTLGFGEVIRLACVNNTPHCICTYLEELAQLFNSFYADVPVLNTPEADLLASRVVLIRSVATVMENGLKILGIKMPPWM